MAKKKIVNKEVFKINPAQKKFVSEYCKHGNATQAYMKAYPKSTYNAARTDASVLLTNPNIAEAVKAEQERLQLKLNITKDALIKELTESAEEAKAWGQFAAYQKLKDMIIKMFGFYEPDKVEHSGNLPITVIKTIEIKKQDE